MQVEHGNHVCEHCAAKVGIARVCPCCGRDHSAKWIATAKKTDHATSVIGCIVWPYAIIHAMLLYGLPIGQFMSGLLDVAINCTIITFVVFIAYSIICGIKPTEKQIEVVRQTFSVH